MKDKPLKFIWFRVEDFSDFGNQSDCLYCSALFDFSEERRHAAFWFDKYDSDRRKYTEDQFKAGFEIQVHETINQLWYEGML